jgi:hypothetical protein
MEGEADQVFLPLQKSGGAILAASISTHRRCLLRCFESGVRCTVFPELFSAPHSPQ